MVSITDLFIACTQAPGETGPMTLVTFCAQIVTENGIFCKRLLERTVVFRKLWYSKYVAAIITISKFFSTLKRLCK